MDTVKVDVAVIGAGTAGLRARREAERNGARVVLIESGPYGTMCARVGCMPSKLLIAAADIAHEIGHAGPFGFKIEGAPRVIGRAVLERVRRERDRFVGFVVESTEGLAPELRLRGRARFIGPTTLEVDGTRVEAAAVVIASGSTPRIPASLEAVRDRVLVNDDVFEMDDLPGSMAVVGTGIIGLELGQALHRLGVRTAFFSHSENLGPLTDPEVRGVAREVLGGELDLRLGTEIEGNPDGSGVRISWKTSEGTSGEEHFDCVLAAAGRTPVLEDLGVDSAGVELDRRGRPLFDPRTMQCGDLPIFVAGDVTGDRPLLHEAADEGGIAGANAARFPDVRAQTRRTPLAVVFTDPQIALAGSRHADLDPERIETGTVSYADQGRARIMAKNAGVVRIYGTRDCGTLVGAEMFGPRVEHTVHLLAWAIQSRLTVDRALEMPFYHPVIEEGIRTALRDLASRLRMSSPMRPAELECGPGT
ncbi:MAG: dihydrolipoyl dehydrogenase [Myxococcota bacterium]